MKAWSSSHDGPRQDAARQLGAALDHRGDDPAGPEEAQRCQRIDAPLGRRGARKDLDPALHERLFGGRRRVGRCR